MRKKQRLIRFTRLWLAMYVMIWCMTFTVCADASAINDNLIIRSTPLQSYVEINNGGYVEVMYVNNQGEKAINNILVFLESSYSNNLSMINNVLFTNQSTDNTTIDTSRVSESPAIFYGGAIRNEDINITFIDNRATYGGGAIYVSKQNDLNTSRIVNNMDMNMNNSSDVIQYEERGVIFSGNQTINRYNSTRFYSNKTAKPEDIYTAITGESLPVDVDEYDPLLYQLILLSDTVLADENRTVNIWDIGNLDANSTAILLVTRNVTQKDIDSGKIDNMMYLVYTDEFDSFSQVNATTTVWTRDPVVVHFKLNDETTSEMNHKVHKGDKVGWLPVPVRDGYDFVGWFTEPSGGKQVDSSTVITENMNLYAHWIEKPGLRKVTFIVVNGFWNDGSSDKKTVLLTDAKKTHMTAAQIPAVGEKPGLGFEAGAWDKVPDTGTVITENTIFTYTYAEKKVPEKVLNNLPQTGDSLNPVIYGFLAILSITGIVLILKWKRKS